MFQEKEFKGKLEKALEHYQIELGKLRTGRANPSLVEDLTIDYYGAQTPLKQLASVSVPEARSLLIQPWDKGSVGAIEKALQSSDLGLNPNNDGDKIRVNLPDLTEETRQDLVKVVNEKKEEAKIAIRNAREEDISALSKDDSISEDEVKGSKEKIQSLVDEYNKKIDELSGEKEKEVMTV